MPKITVALVHYHLRLGGVTRVIEHTIAALEHSNYDVVIISGEEAPEFPFQNRLFVFPQLSYDSHFNGSVWLEEEIQKTVKKAGFAPIEIWHIHNHSLGKNAATPYFVNRLATLGKKMVLQPHDFAEDGRSQNYKKMVKNRHILPNLYPTSQNIRYAFLNSRDRNIFTNSGLEPDFSSVLPNPVQIPESTNTVQESRNSNLILYPSRAIRRKNVGELVLWAALDSDHTYALTLAPKNPKELVFYSFWVEFCDRHSIPVHFEYGKSSQRSFRENLASAKALITTSIKEGFGMAFLEPWLIPKAVFGRNLPEITSDFSLLNVPFHHFYSEIPIPIELLSQETLRMKLEASLKKRYENYGLTLPNEVVQWIENTLSKKTIDFGLLDEEMQATVIEHILNDDHFAAEMKSHIPDYDSISSQEIATCQSIVTAEFSLAAFEKRLSNIYASVIEDDTKPSYLEAESVLEKFLLVSSQSLLTS